MPLSEYEQRVLEQMERQLTSDDPRLANTLTKTGHSGVSRYVIASVGAVVGLVLLVIGVAFSLPLLGVLGFVVMFAAVAFAFANPGRHRGRTGPQGVVTDEGNVRRSTPQKSHRGLMSRLEERWERRRGESGR